MSQSIFGEMKRSAKGFVILSDNRAIYSGRRGEFYEESPRGHNISNFISDLLDTDLDFRIYSLNQNAAIIIIGDLEYTDQEYEILLDLASKSGFGLDNEIISAITSKSKTTTEVSLTSPPPSNVSSHKSLDKDHFAFPHLPNTKSFREVEQLIDEFRQRILHVIDMKVLEVVAAKLLEMVEPDIERTKLSDKDYEKILGIRIADHTSSDSDNMKIEILFMLDQLESSLRRYKELHSQLKDRNASEEITERVTMIEETINYLKKLIEESDY